MQKPQKPKKREDEIGSKHYNWKDWEKKHNQMTGLSFNRLFDVYQRNENVRVRNSTEIESIQKEIEKVARSNRKQVDALREDYQVMMAYAYVYKLHSISQNPDNDELPLMRKRVKVPKPALSKPNDPDLQELPEDILSYYDERPKSFRFPPVTRKWRPASFSGNAHEIEPSESWINDPYPTFKTEEIAALQEDKRCAKVNEGSNQKVRLPPIGTLTLKLSNWKNFGNQRLHNQNRKLVRNAMSEPPSRWRDRETQVSIAQKNRPKSYVPVTGIACKTQVNTKRFFENEAKKALPKFTATHRRVQESQRILRNISNPMNDIIDSKKTTSAILKDYRRKQNELQVKRGPIKVPQMEQKTDTPKAKMFQNWITGNENQ
ncbi:unnamed protein product [Mytilus coruscus]|uniref:Uncharacterized protein n=1 Tax=Mytilus coruscus TaxID=42192 RepID=A0A6J8BSA8_MYTCO|nr:unnamed protein product [Mytilus coruscus]